MPRWSATRKVRSSPNWSRGSSPRLTSIHAARTDPPHWRRHRRSRQPRRRLRCSSRVRARRPTGSCRSSLSNFLASAKCRLISTCDRAGMGSTGDRGELRWAIGVREAARVRLRRATGGVVAVAVVLGGVFAALAAGATHSKRVAVSGTSVRKLPALTSAPAAPLVEVQPAGGSSSSSTPTQSAPAVPPTPSYAPPVVSSGGS
jgi:hypothetical protein